MRSGRFVWLAVCLLALLPMGQGWSKEYRIDSQGDFDRWSNKKFQPGDQILFKRGESFTGMFSPRGSGVEGQPIVIDAYGDGDLPVIHAQGKNLAGLFLNNVSFWEVNRLEITNTNGSEDEDQGILFGIYVLANDRDNFVYEHIHINECYIHHVNGMVAEKKRGGIHVHVRDVKDTRFHNLRITKNRLYMIGGVGIANDGGSGGIDLKPNKGIYKAENLWTEVYFADNYIDYTGRNAMIGRASQDPIYERNILANSSRRDVGHSIFSYHTVGAKIQYNEAYGNVGDGNMDRGGFDADHHNVDTYIQYNYSHDNLWFCGIMKKPNLNVIIRHNISQNDKEGIYFYGFERKKQARNIQIYNNTHYIGRDLDVQVIAENRTPIETVFEKNIFYFEGKGRWGSNATLGRNVVFNDNVYFNIDAHETDKNAKFEDPKFMGRRRALSDIDLNTMRGLSGYRLRSSSPYQGYGAVMPTWLK